MIVLDTSTLIYWTVDFSRLSPPARQAIDASEHRVVSSISIWELALKVKQGRLVLPLSLEDYLDNLTQVSGLEIRSVDAPVWVLSVNLTWEHKDPADRVIVATATHLDCPLITSDRTIAAYYARTIW